MNNNEKNILWIDDDVNRMALLPDRDALKENGLNIVPIDSVKSFRKFIKKEDARQIDCAILDMLMPPDDLDIGETENGTRTGVSLYKELRKVQRYENVPVVVYSVYKKSDFGDFGKRNDIKFVEKSISSSEFVKKITNYINKEKKL